MAKAKGQKKPKAERQPAAPTKRPRRAPELTHNTEKVAWRFGWMDHDGIWSWNQVDAAKHLEIQQKLGHWEDKTWAQILSEDPSAQHTVEVSALIKEAQNRLVEKKLEDCDTLFRFRLTGTERLWGARMENIFYLLWWDPDHEVCPSVKKHT